MFRSIVFLGVVLFSSAVLSASPGEWTPASQISHIFIEGGDSNPILTIALASNPSDDYKPSLCKSHFLYANLAAEKGRAIYSMVLAAKLAGKSLSFTFTDCYVDRPKINQVRFQ